MNAHLPAPRGKWPGRLANLAVVVVVLALVAVTFVLSYAGVHVIAMQAGVSARLARLYPGLFDAVFVIACVAAVMLRDARWWARIYAWLVIIVMVAVVGAADAVHAMSVALPHHETEGVVAAVPWVLVLLGFSLMLTMLRHSRAQHAAVAAAPDGRPDGRAARRAAKRADQALPPALPVPAADETLPAASADSAAGIARPPAPAFALPPAAQEEAVPVAGPVPAAETTVRAQEESAHAEPTPTRQEPALGEPTSSQEEPMAGEPAPTRAEPAVRGAAKPEAARADYWDADEEGEPGGEDYRTALPEIDQDAPPFTTVPFATVPRLNRVRSTPIPPEDDED